MCCEAELDETRAKLASTVQSLAVAEEVKAALSQERDTLEKRLQETQEELLALEDEKLTKLLQESDEDAAANNDEVVQLEARLSAAEQQVEALQEQNRALVRERDGLMVHLEDMESKQAELFALEDEKRHAELFAVEEEKLQAELNLLLMGDGNDDMENEVHSHSSNSSSISKSSSHSDGVGEGVDDTVTFFTRGQSLPSFSTSTSDKGVHRDGDARDSPAGTPREDDAHDEVEALHGHAPDTVRKGASVTWADDVTPAAARRDFTGSAAASAINTPASVNYWTPLSAEKKEVRAYTDFFDCMRINRTHK